VTMELKGGGGAGGGGAGGFSDVLISHEYSCVHHVT